MMHFQAGAADNELLAELKETGVLTPETIDRIDAFMERPETGTLNEFLLAGAGFIPSGPWLSWLIRQHGCHRFGRVAWHEEEVGSLRISLSPEGNLPYRLTAEGRPMIAVLRPDCLAATTEIFGNRSPVLAAATLSEIAAVRIAWAEGMASNPARP